MRVIFLIFSLLFSKISMASSLTVFDAGEGLLARLKTENSSIWIDTGGLLKIRENISRLQPTDESAPTDIILTHLHPDHASGIFELMERYPEINVHDNCMPGISVDDGELIRWTDEFLSSLDSRSCIHAGSIFEFDDVKIEVLWPTQNFHSNDHNFYSLVLRIDSENTSVLMMGDATKKTEKWLLTSKRERLQGIETLIVGHHGSDAATSHEFLALVQPITAVVPVNKNNARGYPSQKTLERILEHGAELWLTGEMGDFRIEFK